MTDTLLILNAAELLTLKGPRMARVRQEMSDLGVIFDGAVAVEGGVISAVGTTEAILKEFDATGIERIDASRKVVMPGLVDPHTHLVFAGSREFEIEMKVRGKTYMEILQDGGGIHRTMRDTRAASSADLYAQSAKRLRSMIAHGTTTVEAKSGYGLDKATELRMLEVARKLGEDLPVDVVPTFMGAHAVPPEFEGRPDEYIQFITDEVLYEVGQRKLAEFCDVFCEKGVFTVEQSRNVLLAAKFHGMKLKIHAEEFHTTGGAELAAELGCTSADHLAKPSDDGIIAMATKDVVGVTLPGTPYTSMKGEYADARRLIDLGVPVALGTDLNPNCWNESMQFAMSLACYHQAMTPAEAISAATINAAAALGLEKRVGSVERGKRADLLVMDVPTFAHIPYRFGTNLCALVLKEGKRVYERSDLTCA